MLLYYTMPYSVSSLLVLLAATGYCRDHSSILGYLALVGALLVHLVQQSVPPALIGLTHWVTFGPQEIIGSAIMVATSFALHVWTFRKWQHAGYELRFV